MATEDDNFDIDIYGDGSGYNTNEQGDQNQDDTELVLDASETAPSAPSAPSAPPANTNQASNANDTNNSTSAESNRPIQSAPTSNGDHAMTNSPTPTQDGPAPPQGVKRKDYDDRPSDPDATSALLISDLFWWETDDDIRGWIAAAGSEDELKDVTFSEHKVNGKSKGQAFVEFTTPQAATASKHKIETGVGLGQSGRKHLVNYTNPHQNPFRTLPKDAPMRKDANRTMGGNFNNAGGNQGNNFGMNMGGGGGGYRGGRGGFNNRGMGGNNFGGRGNFNNMGGFQGGGGPGMMGGFQNGPMGGMQNYGFNNRGGMMGGMRGGPGNMRGRGGGNMGGNNMMAMSGMNPMAGGMGMNPMAGGMNPMMNMGMQGQGFQGPNPAFNQGFFNNQGGNAGGNDSSWNPHGAKRSRQE
ncbi:hypothetical protein N7450_009519 [Penicillium hetheringtonii]|nr:hypothetical protein N7450_009519 [Penicillium hetheringtonii]